MSALYKTWVPSPEVRVEGKGEKGKGKERKGENEETDER